MLLSVDTHELEHRCDACGAVRRIALASLSAGVESGAARPGSPDIVALPACAGCGAREFWRRLARWSDHRESPAASHKRAVNGLHAALVAAGRVAASLREHFAGETVSTERAELPWSYPGEPPPIVARRRAPT